MLSFVTSARRGRLVAVVAAAAMAVTACGGAEDPTVEGSEPESSGERETSAPTTGDLSGVTLTVYSGRGEDLVAEPIARFEEATGATVDVRYGGTSELASTILEEGANSPADVYWAQDAGALGALAAEGRLAELSSSVLDRVEPAFRSPEGRWVGVTGRVRTVVYNTDALTEADVPSSVFDLTDPEWKGRVGWAPTNGSFQSFVTAMRKIHGDDETKAWLEGMLANDVQEYPKNTPIVEAVGRGEIDLGLVNHYYLLRFTAEDPAFAAANAFLADDVGGLVNVAGVGVLDSSEQAEAAEAFIAFMLSEEIQGYFASIADAAEYPLVAGVAASDELPSFDSLDPVSIDLSDLSDLQGTLELLREVGALQ